MKTHKTITVSGLKARMMGFRMVRYYFMHPGSAVPFRGQDNRLLGNVKCDELRDLLPMLIFALSMLVTRRAYFAVDNGRVFWNERCDCGQCNPSHAGKEGSSS